MSNGPVTAQKQEGCEPFAHSEADSLADLDTSSVPSSRRRSSTPKARASWPEQKAEAGLTTHPSSNEELSQSCSEEGAPRTRERHKSLSIHALLENQQSFSATSTSLIATSEAHTMDFIPYSTTQGGVEMQGLTAFVSHVQSPTIITNDGQFSQSCGMITAGFTSDPLTTLPDSSKQEETQGHHAFDAPSRDDKSNLSSYTAAGSRASSALSLATSFSNHSMADPFNPHQSAPQLAFAPEQSIPLGRTRSDTAKRYSSFPLDRQLRDKNVERPAEDCSPGESTASVLHSPSASSSMSTGASMGQVGERESSASGRSGHSLYEMDSGGLINRKKRNKCSPEQIRQLEAFFHKNRNPTGKVREELAKRIQMPERSVQVWFQNKRAKTKNHEIKEGVPLEQRTTVSKTKSSLLVRSASTGTASEASSGRRSRKAVTQSSSMEESVIQLPVTSLSIGQWRRIKPLICIFSRRNQSFTWFLSSESVSFKLECPRSSIKSITFNGPRNPTMHEFGEGVHTPIGHLIVKLDRPPQFYMEVFRSGGTGRDGDMNKEDQDQQQQQQKASWRQCSDFTEGKQATNVFEHVVSGPFAALRQSLIEFKASDGSLAQLLEFQDAQTIEQGGSRGAGTASSEHLAQTETQEQASVQHSDQSTAEGECSRIGESLMIDQSAESQAAYSSPWPSQSWTQDYLSQSQEGGIFHQQHHATQSPSLLTGYPLGHSSYAQSEAAQTPSMPPSASAIDMTGLRIDTGGISTFDAQAAYRSTLSMDSQPVLAPYCLPPWPHTAVAPSSGGGWSQMLSHAGNRGGVNAHPHPLSVESVNASNVAPHIVSAPPYALYSFETQQQQPPTAPLDPYRHRSQLPPHSFYDADSYTEHQAVAAHIPDTHQHHHSGFGETATSMETSPSQFDSVTSASTSASTTAAEVNHDRTSPSCSSNRAQLSPPSADAVTVGANTESAAAVAMHAGMHGMHTAEFFGQASHAAVAVAGLGYAQPSSSSSIADEEEEIM